MRKIGLILMLVLVVTFSVALGADTSADQPTLPLNGTTIPWLVYLALGIVRRFIPSHTIVAKILGYLFEGWKPPAPP